MNLSLLKKVPVVSRAFSWYARRQRRQNGRELSMLLASAGSPVLSGIAAAIDRFVGDDLNEIGGIFGMIERERRLLSADQGQLVDGALGEGGVYDVGLTISQVNKASKPERPAVFLGLLAHALKSKAILELGTNTGISSAYLAAAAGSARDEFQLVTMDSSAYRQRVAQRIHKKLGLRNIQYVQGLFVDSLDRVLRSNQKWDLVFIDGHHQYQPTLDYFNQIYPYCAENAVVVFDDIRWSDGMKKAWTALAGDERAGAVLDLTSIGILVLGRDIRGRVKAGVTRIF